MKAIPKHIRRKLKSIEKHQWAVKRLLDEVTKWANIENVTDDEDGWTWEMGIDLQGAVSTANMSQCSLQEFMERKEAKERTEQQKGT